MPIPNIPLSDPRNIFASDPIQSSKTIKTSSNSGPMCMQSQPPMNLHPAVPSERGQVAVSIALEELGVKENPPDSNSGVCVLNPPSKCVDAYTSGKKEPWCAHFVSWSFEQTGKSPFGHIPLVSNLRNWAKSHGHYYSRSQVEQGLIEPMAGDLFTMDRTDSSGNVVGGHTGFVIRYDKPSQLMETLEGNTSNAVLLRTRRLKEVDGLIRIGE
jgi:hypothetical protein